jgi:hypothetical protein
MMVGENKHSKNRILEHSHISLSCPENIRALGGAWFKETSLKIPIRLDIHLQILSPHKLYNADPDTSVKILARLLDELIPERATVRQA